MRREWRHTRYRLSPSHFFTQPADLTVITFMAGKWLRGPALIYLPQAA